MTAFTPQAAEEARMSLASTAAVAERSNRPRLVVVAAATVLGAALVLLAFAFVSKVSAESRRARELSSSGEILRVVAQIEELRKAPRESGSARIGDADAQLRSKIFSAGQASGLTVTQTPQVGSGRPENGVTRTKLTYAGVRSERLGTVMSWISSAVRDVPALEVESVKIRPEATGWVVDVVFARWERQPS